MGFNSAFKGLRRGTYASSGIVAEAEGPSETRHEGKNTV